MEPSLQKVLDTPVMEQYRTCKEQYPDAILFFRLGDFYEMFFDDAVVASEILGLTLTSRHKEAGVPMAGIPYHSAENYIRKLLDAGRKVALCEQMEKPDKKKKMIAREIVRVFTPGTVVEETALDEGRANYLLGVACPGNTAGLVWCDVSCGEVYFATVPREQVADTVRAIAPAETIGDGPVGETPIQPVDRDDLNDWVPSAQAADYLDHLAPELHDIAVLSDAFRAVIWYLDRLYFGRFPPLRSPLPGRSAAHAALDTNTIANLEIERTLIGGNRQGSLLWAVDRTATVMGRRLLHRLLLQPLRDRAEIARRLDTVERFFSDDALRHRVREKLKEIKDIERTLARILVKRGGPRDIVALCRSLSAATDLRDLVRSAAAELPSLAPLAADAAFDRAIATRWERTFLSDAPLNWRDGGFVDPAHAPEVTRLHRIVHDSKGLLLELEEREKQATGIATLKLGYTKVFGYYLEITKRFAEKTPPHYIRKQTTVNGERYITPELKELEETILTAREKLTEQELAILERTVDDIASQERAIQATALFVAWCDHFSACAEVARERRWERPVMTDEEGIAIVEGRHPVVEQILGPGRYVPATLSVGDADGRLNIITGPNMGGKSTLMRTVALVTLLAQTGSFVPAREARIGVVDALFTRVGASDNLSRGESTFLVEMKETAFILRNATARSLIILDEIGRGTGTYDGISLARAIAEHLVRRVGATVLFATHYHLLTELADHLPGVRNYHMTVREHRGGLQFLYQLAAGGSSRSFGVEVARLAGMPAEVVRDAEKGLRDLERTDRELRLTQGGSMQLDIFALHSEMARQSSGHECLQKIRDLVSSNHPDRMSPKEALTLYYELFTILHSEDLS
ncbi:MAG TPA: DNA mismatch repair protein MutS [bacterium]|nr:DNA mismatch repair protein MutS [bacterium]